ncbi:MAG TPA: hypothetical protein VGX25_26535 [Actinophytocola sp.]|uniref:hypothetical protein n=1 Tax=Actinophytocola sp. TaxID=1872138 RepID=UPI002DDCCBA0|nr:hypothetical protein [Actinophytocola sp.]HEV2782961.1 hypothetical protein [Actinophytocola sp.]
MDLGRRGWSRLVALLGIVAMLCAACRNEVSGQPEPAVIPELTAAESITQSLLNFGEAGTVHYRGTLTSASDEKITFDLTVSNAGEVLGTVTVDDAPGNVLVVNKTLYVKAPAAFWAALRGIGNGQDKGTAIADRWVKLPPVLLGVEFGEMLTPDLVSQNLAKEPVTGGDGALAERPKSTESGLQVIKVPLDLGAMFLAAEPPHGMVKLALSRFGNTDNTRVEDLVAEVADTTGEAGKFYQELAAQAAQLTTAVDALTTVEQGPHRFDACGPESCSLIVEFTNTAKVPVRVHVKANWTGDEAPLGSCEIEVGPVAPGQPGTATCTLATPEWVEFWKRAHSVVGTHPYGASWAPLVLADPPDLSSISGKAQAKPADPKDRKTEGSHYVYSISYADKVWKYGVVGSKYWQDHATGQLRTCLATNRAVCGYSLVTATDNAASAYALEKQLVDAYRSDKGGCPAGQWVSCTR